MMKLILKPFILLSPLLLMILPVSAIKPVNQSFLGGLAIKGYDAVSYFEDGQPAKGKKDFYCEYEGATWHFVSQAHLDKFKGAPEQYAPQFGGYCAWAVSQGYTANIDPEAWKIVDGKLYLNYNKDIQKQWEKDVERLIAAGEMNWPKLLKE